MIRVLFVCLGNICRSPTAQGVFEHLVDQEGLGNVIRVDSAGTAAYHVGEPPDPRAQAAARRRGIDLGQQRARQVTAADCRRYDYILAMDTANLRSLQRVCPHSEQARLQRFLDFAPELGRSDVPDPYYGQEQGFEVVLDMIEAAAQGLLQDIRARHLGSADATSEDA